MTKKASLNLSINAIVVLILAIMMLGISMVVINSLFGGTTARLQNMMGDLDESVKEELQVSDDRITLSSKNIEVSKGKETNIFFAIKNDLEASTGTGTFDLEEKLYCIQAVDASADPKNIRFETYAEMDIESGSSVVLPLTIKPTSSAVSTTYRCYAEICMPGEEESTEITSEICPNGRYERLSFEVIVK